MLDPFAGSGTALFTAIDKGIDSVGIEVMPLGSLMIRVRERLRHDDVSVLRQLAHWADTQPWRSAAAGQLNVLQITDKAYPPKTERAVARCLSAIAAEPSKLREPLLFALLCVLEDVSYTRKDGQFLRWDTRSGRNLRRVFHKGELPDFSSSYSAKLQQIIADQSMRANDLQFPPKAPAPSNTNVRCLNGSCLDILPKIESGQFDVIITSPPYCNRYDYTRTYALELAALRLDEEGLRNLRQNMLSCTVENRAKQLLTINPPWDSALQVAKEHPLLFTIINYLRQAASTNLLNNKGVLRMTEGYFMELTCVISECYRALAPGGHVFMVNDNVRFAGCEISVDLILSSIAEQLGYHVESIMVLPNGKGNSSQQMGKYGRVELRKCIYHWRKL